MLGDTEVNHLSISVGDHEPGVQQSEPDRGNDQEVHRRAVVSVIPKEGAPSLTLIAVGTSHWEISGHGERPTKIPSFSSSARTFRARQPFSFANL